MRSNYDKTVKQITIEVGPESFEEIEKVAAMLRVPIERAAEALMVTQGISEGFLEAEGDLNWRSLTEYLTEKYGSTPRLKCIEEYVDAGREANELSWEERNVLWPHLQTLEKWQLYKALKN